MLLLLAALSASAWSGDLSYHWTNPAEELDLRHEYRLGVDVVPGKVTIRRRMLATVLPEARVPADRTPPLTMSVETTEEGKWRWRPELLDADEEAPIVAVWYALSRAASDAPSQVSLRIGDRNASVFIRPVGERRFSIRYEDGPVRATGTAEVVERIPVRLDLKVEGLRLPNGTIPATLTYRHALTRRQSGQ